MPFNEEHQSFRSLVAEVVRSALAPRVAEWTSTDPLPVGEILGALEEGKCLGAGFPLRQGGIGGDLRHSVVLHEEVARLGSSAIATAVLSHLEVGTRLVADHGSPVAIQRWVPRALRGTAVLGYAATEEEAGSDLAATATSARRDGEAWVLDGRKMFISNARQATALCVLARTGDRQVTSHSLFLVPMSADGVSTSPLSSLGNRGTLGEVRFDDVRLDEDALIGLEGQGLLLQIRRLAHERAFVAVMLSAMADTALRVLLARCREGSGQALQFRLAELLADVEESRSLAYHAVETLASGQDARVAAAMAKLVASRVFRQVADQAVELVGTTGADDPSLSMMQTYGDALGFAFAGGTDHMLLEAIAR